MGKQEKKGRDDLKKYFETGKKPTQEQFEELIDSVSNIVEDEPVRFGDEGVAAYPKKAGKYNVLEIYNSNPFITQSKSTPLWTFNIIGDSLILKNGKGEELLHIKQDNEIHFSNNISLIAENIVSTNKLITNTISPQQTEAGAKGKVTISDFLNIEKPNPSYNTQTKDITLKYIENEAGSILNIDKSLSIDNGISALEIKAYNKLSVGDVSINYVEKEDKKILNVDDLNVVGKLYAKEIHGEIAPKTGMFDTKSNNQIIERIKIDGDTIYVYKIIMLTRNLRNGDIFEIAYLICTLSSYKVHYPEKGLFDNDPPLRIQVKPSGGIVGNDCKDIRILYPEDWKESSSPINIYYHIEKVLDTSCT